MEGKNNTSSSYLSASGSLDARMRVTGIGRSVCSLKKEKGKGGKTRKRNGRREKEENDQVRKKASKKTQGEREKERPGTISSKDRFGDRADGEVKATEDTKRIAMGKSTQPRSLARKGDSSPLFKEKEETDEISFFFSTRVCS